MLTTSKACSRTLMEKVYMAKLAVLISIPRICTTHCPSLALPFLVELSPHGVSRSDRRTPFSLARLSSRMGMKEAIVVGQRDSSLGIASKRYIACAARNLRARMLRRNGLIVTYI